ncbi:hypothetical protein PGB90_007113 [Kerria lacca]
MHCLCCCLVRQSHFRTNDTYDVDVEIRFERAAHTNKVNSSTIELKRLSAEELNSIVGNAFRMAYATQLKSQNSYTETKRNLLRDSQDSLPWNKVTAGKSIETGELLTSTYNDKYFQQKPNTIPGLRVLDNSSSGSNQSTPTSDESNSPTELNIHKRLLEKPPLIKRVPISVKEMLHEEGFPSLRPTPEGCLSFQKESSASSPSTNRGRKTSDIYGLRNFSTCTIPFSHMDKNPKTISENSCSSSDNENATGTCKTFKRHKVSASTTLPPCKITTPLPLPPPPPPMPPERADSLIKHREENELKSAPWFQAGIPREITLEVLSQEPVGAFMVRESTTKSGCYALSLRVPREYHPRGIAHYLIIRTNKGYKIKGFTKEFSTLTALITHHSVMQELLPCPLSLSRYNPSFTKSDTSKDFEDIDSDPDYNTLADFRKMMADLNI